MSAIVYCNNCGNETQGGMAEWADLDALQDDGSRAMESVPCPDCGSVDRVLIVGEFSLVVDPREEQP